jgi:hypothetical protein
LGKAIYAIIGVLAEVTYSVIPEKAGIQKHLKIRDSGSRFACPEGRFPYFQEFCRNLDL